MSDVKKSKKWKSILIKLDSNTVVQYDLDDNQRLKNKMSRQKKRPLISKSPLLKDERHKRMFINEIINKNSHKKTKYEVESISLEENDIQEEPTLIQNDNNFLYNLLLMPLEKNDQIILDKNEAAEIDNSDELEMFFEDKNAPYF